MLFDEAIICSLRLIPQDDDDEEDGPSPEHELQMDANPRSLQPYNKIFAVVVCGPLEKTMILFFIISLATSETTNVGIFPSRRNMRGPCLLETSLKDRCGNVPNWCRFPMKGSFGGDGGRLMLDLLLLLVRLSTRRMLTKPTTIER
ncbi:hypothetical protein PIB30_028327 [Stylosanthes scabra]|uniref:Uncharacterized protein n=1 Tax=Stylosanthes scabra TaxID=79078 RepID=A0ABU6Z7X9_9FABA|nr:hypothetical protein [Stylosanthes scabra]